MAESSARSALQEKSQSSLMTSSSPKIVCRGSSSSEVSEESSGSSGGATGKPHKSNDGRWEAIQAAGPGGASLRHYRLLKKLGSGDIGTVYLAELAGTSSLFAMKIMDKSSLAGRKKLLRAQTERDILQILDHPFLPTLYSHFESERFSCLVMEFCPGGDLHALRQRRPGKRFSEPAAKFYLAEILLALEYLHMLGIVYRDLKPENVLVREDGHIMLSDFDLSLRCFVSPTLISASPTAVPGGGGEDSTCVIPGTCFSPRFLLQRKKTKKELGNQVTPLPELVAEPTDAKSMSFVGTHEYLAPEIIKGEGHGSAVDWWTMGIFLYELLFGKTPFKGSGNRATLFNVVGMPLKFPEGNFPASFAAKDLIGGLLEKEPGRRLGGKRGAAEIKQHPFFEGVNWALVRCAAPPEIPPPVELRRAPLKKEDGGYLEFEFF